MWVFVVLGLAALVSAADQQIVPRECYNATVPVNISARQGVFNVSVPYNNRDVTKFVLSATQQGNNMTMNALTGYKTISGTYNISTQLCRPANDSSINPVIQVLTHGIGFDKTYWDLSFNNYNYSYVNSALAAGYYTLAYDRLGIGRSSHGDAVNEIQTPLEISALRALTLMLREGKFPNANHSFGDNIVHVGHSYGSGQTYAYAAMYPNETSGLVLTGFSTNGTFQPYFLLGGNFQIANQNQPLRFGRVDRNLAEMLINSSPFQDILTPVDLGSLPPSLNYSNGYIVSSNKEANEAQFLHPGMFDPQILDLAEATKQPVTYGEILTLGGAPQTVPFKGPVLVITGENDLPFCGGDCYATGGTMSSIVAGVAEAFSNSPNFSTHIQPNTGHGLNFQYNATAGYQVINNFLGSKGIKSS